MSSTDQLPWAQKVALATGTSVKPDHFSYTTEDVAKLQEKGQLAVHLCFGAQPFSYPSGARREIEKADRFHRQESPMKPSIKLRYPDQVTAFGPKETVPVHPLDGLRTAYLFRAPDREEGIPKGYLPRSSDIVGLAVLCDDAQEKYPWYKDMARLAAITVMLEEAQHEKHIAPIAVLHTTGSRKGDLEYIGSSRKELIQEAIQSIRRLRPILQRPSPDMPDADLALPENKVFARAEVKIKDTLGVEIFAGPRIQDNQIEKLLKDEHIRGSVPSLS